MRSASTQGSTTYTLLRLSARSTRKEAKLNTSYHIPAARQLPNARITLSDTSSPRPRVVSSSPTSTRLRTMPIARISPSQALSSWRTPNRAISPPAFAFVAYPNRDSTPFRDFYNIPEAETVLRGTLRCQGFPAFIQALVALGYLDASQKEWLVARITRAEATQKAIGAVDATEEYVAYVHKK